MNLGGKSAEIKGFFFFFYFRKCVKTLRVQLSVHEQSQMQLRVGFIPLHNDEYNVHTGEKNQLGFRHNSGFIIRLIP